MDCIGRRQSNDALLYTYIMHILLGTIVSCKICDIKRDIQRDNDVMGNCSLILEH